MSNGAQGVRVTFTGSAAELDAFRLEAEEAGLGVVVEDRRSPRGDTAVVVLLVLQGAGHVIERIIDHFGDKLVKRREEQDKGER